MNTTLHWLTTAFDGLVAFLPSLIAGLVILLVGYVVAKVLQRLTRALGRRIGLERLGDRLGMRSETEPYPASAWAGKAVFFVVMLATFLQAARAWNLGFIAVGLAIVMAYLPRVLAACLIFGAALYAANWTRDRLANRRLEGAASTIRFLPSIARGVILAVGMFMVLRELEFAPDIVNAAFIIILSGIAVAGAIAFGFGGRDVAGRIAQSWYERRTTNGSGKLGTRPPLDEQTYQR
jgi:hypothetical protein